MMLVKFGLIVFTVLWSVVDAQPVVVYAHGLASRAERMKNKVIDRVFPEVSSYGKNGPESQELVYDRKKICFAQQADIDVLIAACTEALDNGLGQEIIGFGFSKGAATWLNMLGYIATSTDSQHKRILAAIKAVVVIAPFADPFEPEMLLGMFRKLRPIARRCTFANFFGVGRGMMVKLLKRLCPAYDPQGVHPITSVGSIPSYIPIFIAHSCDDEVIPVSQSRILYERLISNEARLRANNTYLFEFKGFRHRNSSRLCTLWHKPVYAFLNRYNLLPQALSAVDSGYNLNTLQPDLLEMTRRKFANTVVPSIAYGLAIALVIEAYKYIYNKTQSSQKYAATFKKSLAYGALFSLWCEACHYYKKQKQVAIRPS